LLIQTGIGPAKARSITRQILESESWDVVISTGFAGALNSSPIGSLVIGNEVMLGQSADLLADSDPQRIVCHPDWVNTSLNIKLMGPYPLQGGRFVTMDRVLTHASQKHILGKRTGAVAVDMESGAIGQVAQQHGLPFLIVRAISDGVNEDLPVDFNVFLRPFGWLEECDTFYQPLDAGGGFFDCTGIRGRRGYNFPGFLKNSLPLLLWVSAQLPP
jgi:adenosylhomocysteine nucleosidase